MSTGKFAGGKGWAAREAENLTSICDFVTGIASLFFLLMILR
jgi:hypothetical protein